MGLQAWSGLWIDLDYPNHTKVVIYFCGPVDDRPDNSIRCVVDQTLGVLTAYSDDRAANPGRSFG